MVVLKFIIMRFFDDSLFVPEPGPYIAGGQGGQLPPPGKLFFFF